MERFILVITDTESRLNSTRSLAVMEGVAHPDAFVKEKRPDEE
jgi:hypothetical protein